MEDTKIICADCKNSFTFSGSEQKFFRSMSFKDPRRCRDCRAKAKQNRPAERAQSNPAFKNWKVTCETCDMGPTVGDTGLCGPCTWGEAETANGNW